MSKDKNNFNLHLLVIVGIVAIVGIIVMASNGGNNRSAVSVGDGNLAGDAKTSLCGDCMDYCDSINENGDMSCGGICQAAGACASRAGPRG